MSNRTGHWPQWLKNAAKAVANVLTQVKAVLSIPSTVVKIAVTSVGTPKFMTHIAVPSRIGAALNVEDYYSQPWERSADFFGGATHSYSDNSGFWAGLYFIMP